MLSTKWKMDDAFTWRLQLKGQRDGVDIHKILHGGYKEKRHGAFPYPNFPVKKVYLVKTSTPSCALFYFFFFCTHRFQTTSQYHKCAKLQGAFDANNKKNYLCLIFSHKYGIFLSLFSPIQSRDFCDLNLMWNFSIKRDTMFNEFNISSFIKLVLPCRVMQQVHIEVHFFVKKFLSFFSKFIYCRITRWWKSNLNFKEKELFGAGKEFEKGIWKCIRQRAQNLLKWISHK